MNNENNNITPYNSNITDLLNQLIGALRNGTETTMINNQLLNHMFMSRDSQNHASSQSWIGWGVGLVGSTISFGLQSLFMIGQIFMIISIIRNVIGRGNNPENQNAQNLTQEQISFLNSLRQNPNLLNKVINTVRNNNDTEQYQNHDRDHFNEQVFSNAHSHMQQRNQKPLSSLNNNSTYPHTSQKKTTNSSK